MELVCVAGCWVKEVVYSYVCVGWGGEGVN